MNGGTSKQGLSFVFKYKLMHDDTQSKCKGRFKLAVFHVIFCLSVEQSSHVFMSLLKPRTCFLSNLFLWLTKSSTV